MMKSNAGQVDVGWSFEEFRVGRQVVSPERTITEADARDFASLTGDDHPLHVDTEYASTTEFGERIAHGLLGLSVAFGLLRRAGVIGTSLLALLEVRAWRFLAPLRLGDTVRGVMVVRAARPSRSRPDRGVVTVSVTLERGDGATAQIGELVLLTRRAWA